MSWLLCRKPAPPSRGWTTLTVLAAAHPRKTVEENPIEETGSWEFTSARDPSQVYQVTEMPDGLITNEFHEFLEICDKKTAPRGCELRALVYG